MKPLLNDIVDPKLFGCNPMGLTETDMDTAR